MVSISALRSRLDDDTNWVVIDPQGAPLEVGVPADVGPATLLVGPVTDALKARGDGDDIVSSVDRDDVYAVEGFALHRVVLDRLEDVEVDTRGLFELVKTTEIAWQFKPLTEMVH